MNEFEIYEAFCRMEQIALKYKRGLKHAEQFKRMAGDVASRRYNVAVVGEFKCGKSSLVNALLGTKILPTDILPTTAVINRITYGDKRIVISYKDGTIEQRTIEELEDFATKLDSVKAHTADKIAEISVYMPSAFCKNSIDIYDTPGMNDDERMTAITLGVLNKIDTAIMVISAKKPLSITEQKLIIQMIAHKEIRHITFVVTCIDAISDEEDERDKIIGFIRNRLSAETLKSAEKFFEDDKYFAEKARRILTEPEVYGVSSVLAMKGFLTDNNKILKESRFPQFKEQLFLRLTENQSLDIAAKVHDCIKELEDNIEKWKNEELKILNEEIAWLTNIEIGSRNYIQSSEKELEHVLGLMDKKLKDKGVLGRNAEGINAWRKGLEKIFIEQLSKIRIDEIDLNADTISAENLRKIKTKNAINEAMKIGMEKSLKVTKGIIEYVADEADKVAEGFGAFRNSAGIEEDAEMLRIGELDAEFVWVGNSPEALSGEGEVIIGVRNMINESISSFTNRITAIIGDWKSRLHSINAEDIKKLPTNTSKQINELKLKCRICCTDYKEHIKEINIIAENLNFTS